MLVMPVIVQMEYGFGIWGEENNPDIVIWIWDFLD